MRQLIPMLIQVNQLSGAHLSGDKFSGTQLLGAQLLQYRTQHAEIRVWV